MKILLKERAEYCYNASEPLSIHSFIIVSTASMKVVAFSLGVGGIKWDDMIWN